MGFKGAETHGNSFTHADFDFKKDFNWRNIDNQKLTTFYPQHADQRSFLLKRTIKTRSVPKRINTKKVSNELKKLTDLHAQSFYL